MTSAPRDPTGNVPRATSAPPQNWATEQEREARLLTITAACFFLIGLLTMHIELINVADLTFAVVSPALAAAALWTFTKPVPRSARRRWPRGRRRLLLLLAAGIPVCSPLLIGFTVHTIIGDFWTAVRALNFPNAEFWRNR